MKFRSEIICEPGSKKIDHDSVVFLIGSCFSENMSEKFDYYKFKTHINPFGILFNPSSIENAINRCVHQLPYSSEDLINHQGNWLSLDHHSRFDQKDAEQTLKLINDEIRAGHNSIVSASHIIITLGSAWIYKWEENGQIVGNCHKIPQKKFTKELLSSEAIEKNLVQISNQIRSVNKTASLIFTVSPVRHLKDGFAENTLSKSLLHKAIHDLKTEHGFSYFPSYEIMMDDLRDYRFYEQDLVHPNKMAIEYIWNLFKTTWLSEKASQLMLEIEDIQRSLAHRPIDPESEAHKKFVSKLNSKIRELKARNPQIDFIKKGSS